MSAAKSKVTRCCGHYKSFHLCSEEMEEIILWGVHHRRRLGHGFKPLESFYSSARTTLVVSDSSEVPKAF